MSGHATTPYLHLVKPTIGGDATAWGGIQNGDLDAIDASASSVAGRLGKLLGRIRVLESKPPPALSLFVGFVMWWPADDDFPPDVMICDGTLLSPAVYPELFKVLGTRWGGDGAATFALPDLRGRVLVGLDGGTGRLAGQYGADQPGIVGGAATIALATGNLVSHAHTVTVNAAGAHAHGVANALAEFGADSTIENSDLFVKNAGGLVTTMSAAPAHQHNALLDVAGGGAPLPLGQPGALGHWLIKVL